MVKDYSNTLRYIIPATNDGNGVVLNGNFREWSDHIARNLSNRSFPGDGAYKGGLDKKLLALCRDHAREYQTAKLGESTMMLTHPFYLPLSHMDELRTDSVRREAQEYLETLLNLLSLKRKKSSVGVVALETVHHYAAVTSLLLERGLIDRVVFTLYDSGSPLDTDDLGIYRKDEIFFGGGYNGRCLSRSIIEMKKKLTSGDIWAIKELVLNSPQEFSRTLRVSRVDGLSPSKMIPLKETVKRWGL